MEETPQSTTPKHAYIFLWSRERDERQPFRARALFHVADDGRVRLFGGACEHREDPRDAAVRELAEELGLHVYPEDLSYVGASRCASKTWVVEQCLFTLCVEDVWSLVRPALAAKEWTREVCGMFALPIPGRSCKGYQKHVMRNAMRHNWSMGMRGLIHDAMACLKLASEEQLAAWF